MMKIATFSLTIILGDIDFWSRLNAPLALTNLFPVPRNLNVERAGIGQLSFLEMSARKK